MSGSAEHGSNGHIQRLSYILAHSAHGRTAIILYNKRARQGLPSGWRLLRLCIKYPFAFSRNIIWAFRKRSHVSIQYTLYFKNKGKGGRRGKRDTKSNLYSSKSFTSFSDIPRPSSAATALFASNTSLSVFFPTSLLIYNVSLATYTIRDGTKDSPSTRWTHVPARRSPPSPPASDL